MSSGISPSTARLNLLSSKKYPPTRARIAPSAGDRETRAPATAGICDSSHRPSSSWISRIGLILIWSFTRTRLSISPTSGAVIHGKSHDLPETKKPETSLGPRPGPTGGCRFRVEPCDPHVDPAGPEGGAAGSATLFLVVTTQKVVVENGGSMGGGQPAVPVYPLPPGHASADPLRRCCGALLAGPTLGVSPHNSRPAE